MKVTVHESIIFSHQKISEEALKMDSFLVYAFLKSLKNISRASNIVDFPISFFPTNAVRSSKVTVTLDLYPLKFSIDISFNFIMVSFLLLFFANSRKLLNIFLQYLLLLFSTLLHFCLSLCNNCFVFFNLRHHFVLNLQRYIWNT